MIPRQLITAIRRAFGTGFIIGIENGIRDNRLVNVHLYRYYFNSGNLFVISRMEKKKGIIILTVFLAMMITGCSEEPEELPTEVHLTCFRTNNTPCVMNGTCLNYEEHSFNVDDTDLIGGDFVWYDNSWCNVEWK